MQEAWADILEWEGLYQVSSHGRVRSFDRIVRCGYGRTRCYPGRILSASLCQGYPRVVLHQTGQRPARQVFVHQLVCESFHGPAPTKAHEVAHKDGNRMNCRAENLRWSTHRENEADKRRHGTNPAGERHGGAKLDWKKVRAIRALSGSHEKIAADFGVSRRTVGRILSGQLWREAEAA